MCGPWAEESKENSAIANSPFHPFLPLSPPAWQGEEQPRIAESICRWITLFGREGEQSLVCAVCLEISESLGVCRLCSCPAEGQTSSALLLFPFVLLELLWFCCHSFPHCRELAMSLLNVLSTLNRALCSRVWNAHWVSKAFGFFAPILSEHFLCISSISSVTLHFPHWICGCFIVWLTFLSTVGLFFQFSFRSQLPVGWSRNGVCPSPTILRQILIFLHV